MSRYHLTEAYGELYNQNLTEASFYDNLRFVDFLQPEQIEEVMESLIWEFMDYGDTLDEAADKLRTIFSDEELLYEAIDELQEATKYVTYGRGDVAGAARRHEEGRKQKRQDQVQKRYDSYASHVRQHRSVGARLGRRTSSLRSALSSAVKTVSDTARGLKKRVTDNITNARTKGANVAKAQTALQQTARKAVAASSTPNPNAFMAGELRRKNAAKAAAAPAPVAPKYTFPGYKPFAGTSSAPRQLTDYEREQLAKTKASSNRSYAERFPTATSAAATMYGQTPTSATNPGAKQAQQLRSQTARSGRTIAPPAPATPAATPTRREFGSKKSREQKEKNAAAIAAAKAKMEAREAARKARKKI